MSKVAASGQNTSRIRLDKWLFYARIIKSRTLAAKFIGAGHVRINGEKTNQTSQNVKPDDVLTISLERTVKILKIKECGTRRGPAPEAQALYDDLSPPPEEKPLSGFEAKIAKKRGRFRQANEKRTPRNGPSAQYLTYLNNAATPRVLIHPLHARTFGHNQQPE